MNEVTFHGEKPQTRDLSAHREKMSDWVSKHLAAAEPARMISLEPTPEDSNGYVGESFILDVARGRPGRETDQRFLLKRKPTKHRYFPEHDFQAEFRVQEVLARDGTVPVAPVGEYEPDETILGSPFYLLGFVDGRALTDRPYYSEGVWLAELPASDQRAICISGLSALAAIHAVPIAASGAGFLHRAKPGEDQIDWN